MYKLLSIILTLSILLSACSDDTPKKPYIRKPMNIVIQNNAAWDGFIKTDETEADCKNFVLTEKDVREFFMEALEESETAYAQSQLSSRCYVEGTLFLPRKFKAKWRIDRARRGVLMVENDHAYFFYCDLCVSSRYAQRR